MSSRRRRRKSRRSDKPGHDEHVGAYGRERRRKGIMECRDYRGYEGKRKEEGGARGAGIRHLRKLIRGALHDADERDAAGIVCPAGMAFRSHPYGVRAACMSEHPGSAGMYGLKKVPPRSVLGNVPLRAAAEQLDGGWTAGGCRSAVIR